MADVVFIITFLLFSKREILSLVYGGVAGTLVLCVIAGVLSFRLLRIGMDWLNVLAVPLGAGGISGLVCMLLNRLFAGLGALPAMLLAFLISGMLYWILLLVLRNIKEQELETFPGGRLLAVLGQRMHLYS